MRPIKKIDLFGDFIFFKKLLKWDFGCDRGKLEEFHESKIEALSHLVHIFKVVDPIITLFSLNIESFVDIPR